jgi:hypothetical protein
MDKHLLEHRKNIDRSCRDISGIIVYSKMNDYLLNHCRDLSQDELNVLVLHPVYNPRFDQVRLRYLNRLRGVLEYQA